MIPEGVQHYRLQRRSQLIALVQLQSCSTNLKKPLPVCRDQQQEKHMKTLDHKVTSTKETQNNLAR